MEKLEITIHPEKTKIVELIDKKQSFVFLGFEHRRRLIVSRSGQLISRIRQTPSKKAFQSMRDKVKAILGNRGTLNNSLEFMIKLLNRRLQGFKNYYRLRYPSHKLGQFDWFVLNSFTRWYNWKRQIRPRLRGLNKVYYLIRKLGIVRLA